MAIKTILLVGFGGAIGSIARYAGQKYFQQLLPYAFPFGTFMVNVIGCFLIGILYGIASRFGSFSAEFRMLMMTGFCGGFTTFSAFTLEGMQLLNQGRFVIFFLYFALSVGLGLMATFAGALITQ